MMKLLMTTAMFIALAQGHAKATTETFCGPSTEGGNCEGVNEQKVFLNEGHDEISGSGTVGQGKNAPLFLFTTDGGLLDIAVDTGGGFANITASHSFPDFNGIDITIPGFTFTDIVFDAQLNPTEESGTDTFTAQGFSGAHISDGIATGSDTPENDKQYSLNAVGGVFDEVNLQSFDGFKEIKHIEISGLAALATPEPSTWAMLVAGFGLLGLIGFRRSFRRSCATAAV